jgi:hypothetical protein
MKDQEEANLISSQNLFISRYQLASEEKLSSETKFPSGAQISSSHLYPHVSPSILTLIHRLFKLCQKLRPRGASKRLLRGFLVAGYNRILNWIKMATSTCSKMDVTVKFLQTEKMLTK